MDMSETDRINISKTSLVSFFYEKTGGKKLTESTFQSSGN